MPKLTEYQIKTLRRISEGKVEGTVRHTHRTIYSYFDKDYGAYGMMEIVNAKTIERLRKLNLIFEIGKPGSPFSTIVRITDAGKQAIGLAP